MLSAFLALLALKSQVPEIPPSSEIWTCAIIKGEDIATFIGRTVLHILQDKLDYFPHFSLLSGGFIHLDYLFTHMLSHLKISASGLVKCHVRTYLSIYLT